MVASQQQQGLAHEEHFLGKTTNAILSEAFNLEAQLSAFEVEAQG
jgi:hypothetical protein